MTDSQTVFVPVAVWGARFFHTRLDCEHWPVKVLAYFDYTRERAEELGKEPCSHCARIAPRPAERTSP